jgi:hypothetical protein
MPRTTKRRRTKVQQLDLPFRCWGGARRGAGRKPKNGIVAGVRHEPRAVLAPRHPAHVLLTTGWRRHGLLPLAATANGA